MVVLLRDVAHAAPASSCLVLPEEAARRLRFEVEECGQLQADAIAEGEMREVRGKARGWAEAIWSKGMWM